ncbi:NTP transferase domain-containing protein [bacterium]|nr:NTP transferase domain-containing protein [bacterium]
MGEKNLWAIVLAAGDGRRLSAFTANSQGVSVPKQYCSFGCGRPMLHWALDRAASLAPPERVVTVVARDHRSFWEGGLPGLPDENVIVQPRNRGTAAGILLPLIEIMKRDADAIVVLLPSDHHVEDEEKLREAALRAAEAVEERRERLVLLGISPGSAETEYGWILPRTRRGLTRPVARFVEKPDPLTAAELLREGAVWNSFVIVSYARTLLELYGQALPRLLEAFLRELVVAPGPGSLERLYAEVPTVDFSRDLLERVCDRLELLVVSPCGWTDLGTPARLKKFLETSASRRQAQSAALSA